MRPRSRSKALRAQRLVAPEAPPLWQAPPSWIILLQATKQGTSVQHAVAQCRHSQPVACELVSRLWIGAARLPINVVARHKLISISTTTRRLTHSIRHSSLQTRMALVRVGHQTLRTSW